MSSITPVGRALIVVAIGLLVAFVARPYPALAENLTRKAQQEATAETAGNDFFATDIEVEQDGTIRAHVCLATSGVFSIVIKHKVSGAVLDVVEFNGSTGALTADRGYTFDWPSRVDREYNYRTSVNGDVTIYVDHVETN